MSSLSSRCVIPFAPEVRSRCRPVTCASRCVRKVAPWSPHLHPSPLCGLPLFQVRDFPRTWSPFPLSVSHFRFQVREKSRTSEPHPTPQSSVWPFLSPRCVISLAPGVRSRCRPVTCASRCMRKVAPWSPHLHPSPLCGLPLFQVRDFPRTWSPFPLSASHLRFQVREKSRTSESHPASQPSVWPFRSLRCAISLAPGTRNGSCSMICGSRCELAVEYLDGSLICLYLADGKGMEFRP